jgi:hypothetical protein
MKFARNNFFKFILVIFLIIIFKLSNFAYAGIYDYKCTIFDSSTVDESGKRKSAYLSNNEKTFMVDRSKGVIIGSILSNSTADIRILDKGGSQQSFKVLTNENNPFPTYSFLIIEEFRDKLEKPFQAFHTNFGIYLTGICK